MYMQENFSKGKIFLFIIGLLLLGVIMIALYLLSKPTSYENAKIDKSKNYVYLKESNFTSQDKHIPYINVKGKTAKRYNEEIEKLEEEFAVISENKIGYTFNKSKNILSLSIKMVDYLNFGHPSTKYKTYIINLENQKAYTKEEIYRDYQVNDKKVKEIIKKGFQKMYKEEVKKKYIDSNECDYKCFLTWRGVEDYLDGAQLYIQNRQLVVFRGFDTESIFGEEQYFNDSHFQFAISK